MIIKNYAIGILVVLMSGNAFRAHHWIVGIALLVVSTYFITKAQMVIMGIAQDYIFRGLKNFVEKIGLSRNGSDGHSCVHHVHHIMNSKEVVEATERSVEQADGTIVTERHIKKWQ